MDDIAVKSNNSFAQFRPMTAILLFCVLILSVCFYDSRKVILWEDQEGGNMNLFQRAVLAYANVAENVKSEFKLDQFFQNENMVWRALKESPLVFGQPEASEIVPLENEPLSVERENIGEILPSQPLVIATNNLATTTLQLSAATTTVAGASTTTAAVAATTTAPVANNLLRQEGTQTVPVISNPNKKNAPFRILIVGDSFIAVGGGLGDPLEKTLLTYKQTVVTRQGKVSSGLSRQDYFDWPAQTKKLITQHNPNVAIMMFGANDSNPVIDSNGKIVASYGSAKWEEQYGKRIDQMLDLFKAANAETFVIGVPIMKNQKLSKAIEKLNSLYEKETRKYSNAHYFSTRNLLSDKNGDYTDSLLDKNGKKRRIRTSDGVHLQYYAGYYVTDAIIKGMKNYLNLNVK